MDTGLGEEEGNSQQLALETGPYPSVCDPQSQEYLTFAKHFTVLEEEEAGGLDLSMGPHCMLALSPASSGASCCWFHLYLICRLAGLRRRSSSEGSRGEQGDSSEKPKGRGSASLKCSLPDPH
jgi:hypothetical protein